MFLIKFFCHELQQKCAIVDEVHNEKAKQSIRSKCNDYLERAEKLKGYLKKNSGKEKAVATGENDKK